jgi:hypothetical protein
MVAPKTTPLERHRDKAREIAHQVEAKAQEHYGDALKRTTIASVLGAYATQIVDYLADLPITGAQKRHIAITGGKILAVSIAAIVRPSLGLGVLQLTNWLEALIEITCSEDPK